MIAKEREDACAHARRLAHVGKPRREQVVVCRVQVLHRHSKKADRLGWCGAAGSPGEELRRQFPQRLEELASLELAVRYLGRVGRAVVAPVVGRAPPECPRLTAVFTALNGQKP